MTIFKHHKNILSNLTKREKKNLNPVSVFIQPQPTEPWMPKMQQVCNKHKLKLQETILKQTHFSGYFSVIV